MYIMHIQIVMFYRTIKWQLNLKTKGYRENLINYVWINLKTQLKFALACDPVTLMDKKYEICGGFFNRKYA